MAAVKHKALSFEQSMSRLDEIANRLENPETGLEETIKLVEEGLRLVKSGRELLDAAELRIKVLENPPAEQAPAKSTAGKHDADKEFTLI